jgi:hypothetical protein
MKSSWDAYVLKKPLAKPFQNPGWDLWDGVFQLMPHKMNSSNVYNASQATSNSQNDSQFQDFHDPSNAVGIPGSSMWDKS